MMSEMLRMDLCNSPTVLSQAPTAQTALIGLNQPTADNEKHLDYDQVQAEKKNNNLNHASATGNNQTISFSETQD